MSKRVEHEITRQMFEPIPMDAVGAGASGRGAITYWKDAWRRLRRNRVAMVSIAVLVIIVLCAIVIPMVSPYDYAAQDIFSINKAPSQEHLFGADNLGRDIFTRCWEGARVSLTIALVATLINVMIGVLYGGISGYFGGRVDMIMMRGVEIIYTIPDLLWVIMLMVALGSGERTIIIAIAITGWGSMARLVRGQILQLKQSEYVMASRTLGGRFVHIIVRHLLPNLMGPIIIDLTFSIPSAIFTEASLSYLGMGVPVPMASWGTLANEGAKMLLLQPYQLFFPALLISLTMLSFNMLGDGLRDALDPRLRR